VSVKKGLGRGLQALIPEYDNETDKNIENLSILDIEPNPYQPRKHFNDESLKELSESIKEHGIIQPIIVRKLKNSFEIVAGERRWRASKMAGLKEIPAIIKEFDDQQVMEIALIENLQREDINPIDEAKAYKALIEKFNLTQEEISKRVGKSRSAIANSIRLLNLDERVQNMVLKGEITNGHAKVILSLQDKDKQYVVANKIQEKNLNVRETEKLIKTMFEEKKITNKNMKEKDSYAKDLEDDLCSYFGTKVRIIKNSDNKGKIQIEYYNNEDLIRIIDLIYKKNN